MTNAKEQRRRAREYQQRQESHERRIARRKRDNWIAGGLLAIGLCVGITGTLLTSSGSGTDAAAGPSPSVSALPNTSAQASASPAQRTDAVPEPAASEHRVWKGSLVINSVPLEVELDGAAAPQAVAAVTSAARDGFYNGKTCHRLTTSPGFQLLQCGSVNGDGMGDPSFQYGPIENAPENDVYPAGTIAMARAGGNPNSNGYQFFLVYEDTTIPRDSAGGYTVIGHLTAGLDDLRRQVVSIGVGDGSADGAPARAIAISAFDLQ